MQSTTYDAARGRWREIFTVLGVELPKGENQPCPMCGGTDRFTFSDRNRDGDYLCRQCGAGRGIKLVQGIRGWDFKQAALEVDAIIGNLPAAQPVKQDQPKPPSTNTLNSLWFASHLVTQDCPAGRYLKARGLKLDLELFKGTLRGVSHCYHSPSGERPPALLARFCDPEGKPKQLHRTFLTEDGRKADVKPNRMWMQGCLPEGGAVRLGQVAPAMGVAEGVETALSASQLFGLPVWATTSAGVLSQWRPPKEVLHVTIFADHDRNHVGQKAAEELAWWLFRQGVTVEVKVPTEPGTDWNDVLVNGKVH